MTKETLMVILRRILGVILVIIGLAIILTPLTPGSILLFIGLQLLGVRLFFKTKV